MFNLEVVCWRRSAETAGRASKILARFSVLFEFCILTVMTGSTKAKNPSVCLPFHHDRPYFLVSSSSVLSSSASRISPFSFLFCFTFYVLSYR